MERAACGRNGSRASTRLLGIKRAAISRAAGVVKYNVCAAPITPGAVVGGVGGGETVVLLLLLLCHGQWHRLGCGCSSGLIVVDIGRARTRPEGPVVPERAFVSDPLFPRASRTVGEPKWRRQRSFGVVRAAAAAAGAAFGAAAVGGGEASIHPRSAQRLHRRISSRRGWPRFRWQ
jgi:hypothetical protein